MRSASIEEAKERLRELIDAARAGDDIEITDGGRVVAVIVRSRRDEMLERFQQSQPDPAEEMERIARLVADGALSPSRGGNKPELPLLDEPIEPLGLLDALLDERRSGR